MESKKIGIYAGEVIDRELIYYGKKVVFNLLIVWDLQNHGHIKIPKSQE